MALKTILCTKKYLTTILWKFQSSYEWRVNTVNRYIVKSIILIARKPITRCYMGIKFNFFIGIGIKSRCYLLSTPRLSEENVRRSVSHWRVTSSTLPSLNAKFAVFTIARHLSGIKYDNRNVLERLAFT